MPAADDPDYSLISQGVLTFKATSFDRARVRPTPSPARGETNTRIGSQRYHTSQGARLPLLLDCGREGTFASEPLLTSP